MKILFFMTLCATAQMFAQHTVPFASKNNSLELHIRNSSAVEAEKTTIELASPPSWLHFTTTTQTIGTLKAQQSSAILFPFSVDKTAPVNLPLNLTFSVHSATGEKWTKQVSFQVSPPDHFELYQNYPNPFNPSTTISYLLPQDTRVILKIYNSIGQEVKTLVNDDRSAGYHQEVWNASNVASGMYIYQITINNQQGKKEFYRRKMLVVK